MDWSPFILSLKLGLVTTSLLLVLGIPLVYLLTEKKFVLKPVIESLVALPLVLPPTVLGFYLLLLLSPKSAIGQTLDQLFGIQLVFSFWGLVLGSLIYSLPFMIQPIQNGINQLPDQNRSSAYLIGYSKFKTFRTILLPNIKPAILTACVLTFAHTLGEFGVVLMIGGNIPDETRVASIAVYESVEALNFEQGHWYASLLLGMSFVILLGVNWLNRSNIKIWR